jgi:hypothetical protein
MASYNTSFFFQGEIGSQLRDVDALYYFQTKINERVIASRIEIIYTLR